MYTPSSIVTGTGTVTAIVAGNLHTCVLTSTGGVRCWGTNTYGQLGYGDTTHRGIPGGDIVLGGSAVAISSGDDFMCAIISPAVSSGVCV